MRQLSRLAAPRCAFWPALPHVSTHVNPQFSRFRLIFVVHFARNAYNALSVRISMRPSEITGVANMRSLKS